MANIFKNQVNGPISERARLEAKYNTARYDLLLVVIFTVVNIVLAIFGSGTYFLFSATVPYTIVLFGAIMCGRFPQSYYDELGLTNEFLPIGVLVIMAVIALAITALYFVFWLLSKKKVGFLIAALVFFSIDTFFLIIGGISIEMIFDILFHAWVIYGLIAGIVAHSKLKNLPEEDFVLDEKPEWAAAESGAETASSDTAASAGTDTDTEGSTQSSAEPSADNANEEKTAAPDSRVIRRADWSVKSRVLLQAEVNGSKICYRRVKRVNELVVDSFVYDEIEMLAEPPHELTATVNGHRIRVGYDGTHSYIIVDSKTVERKRRIF